MQQSEYLERPECEGYAQYLNCKLIYNCREGRVMWANLVNIQYTLYNFKGGLLKAFSRKYMFEFYITKHIFCGFYGNIKTVCI